MRSGMIRSYERGVDGSRGVGLGGGGGGGGGEVRGYTVLEASFAQHPYSKQKNLFQKL